MPVLHWCNPWPVHTQSPTSRGSYWCPPGDFSDNTLFRNPKILCLLLRKQPAVPRKQSKCCRTHTREEKALLAQSSLPAQWLPLAGEAGHPQGLGHEYSPVSDSAHRTLSFRHCQHKGSDFHTQMKRENIKKIIFHFTWCLHRTLSPLAYPLFLKQACSQERELPIRSLTDHGPPQVTNLCLWLLHSDIRPLLVQGFHQKCWWFRVLGSAFFLLQLAAKHKAERHRKSKQHIWSCLQPKPVSAAS